MGILALLLGVALLVPIGIAAASGGPDVSALALSALIAAASGILLVLLGKKAELGVREAIAVVTGSWLLYALLGGLPYLLSGVLPTLTDSFFEAMAGFTTTGTTVVTNIEALPTGILFWRNFTQWLGGMGIIVLSVALLPYLGVGGMELLRTEASGLTVERIVPRIRETAMLLWGVYAVLTLAETVLLSLGGMSVFEAVLHSFATMATGGFSPKNASVAAYPSPYLQWVIIVFMFLAGANFTLHYLGLRGRLSAYWKNGEFRFYLGATAVSILLTAAALWWAKGPAGGAAGAGVERTLRDAAFQALSLITTTGFATADFELWPVVVQGLFLFLMLIGGCAGSTAGGIKYVRIVLMGRYARAQMQKLVHRRAVKEISLDGRPVADEVSHGVQAFFFLYLSLWVAGSAALTALGMDLVSALSAVAANMGNVGPGLGAVGPTDNYFGQPAAAKWLLSVLMLAGRLEIFPVLALLTRGVWRK
ncbi:MAG: TrkH family potassium uptake protein [Nitrospinota bacterium]